MGSEKKKRKLILLTERYPYIRGEDSFILPELRRLSKIYDITVIACGLDKIPKEVCCELPEGVVSKYYVVPNKGLLFSLYKHFIFNISLAKQNETKPDRAYFVRGMLFERWFRRQDIVQKDEDFILYSFWYMWWLVGFCERKEKYKNIFLLSRTHGYDLYNERRKDGKQPFKTFMDKQLDLVLFVSEFGKNYYIDTFANKPLIEKKYLVNYLGQDDNRKNIIKKPEDGTFYLVSCSNVIPLKRVELIAEALEKLDSMGEIHWTHFGDGIMYEELTEHAKKAMANNPLLEVSLKGRVANTEVLNFYNANWVDCFITTSSTEGLPVSISEAMSFSIPIIATDVGGISEQIDGNGVLLPANPEIDEIRGAIENQIKLSEKELEIKRHRSRELWEEKFFSKNSVNLLTKGIEDDNGIR